MLGTLHQPQWSNRERERVNLIPLYSLPLQCVSEPLRGSRLCSSALFSSSFEERVWGKTRYKLTSVFLSYYEGPVGYQSCNKHRGPCTIDHCNPPYSQLLLLCTVVFMGYMGSWGWLASFQGLVPLLLAVRNFAQNFVLQAINAQGLGTRLGIGWSCT